MTKQIPLPLPNEDIVAVEVDLSLSFPEIIDSIKPVYA